MEIHSGKSAGVCRRLLLSPQSHQTLGLALQQGREPCTSQKQEPRAEPSHSLLQMGSCSSIPAMWMGRGKTNLMGFLLCFFFQNALEGAEALQTPGRMMCLIVCFFICLFISAKEFWGFWLKEKTCLCPCLIGSGNKCTAWCCRAENATRSLTSSVQVGISCQIIPGKER